MAILKTAGAQNIKQAIRQTSSTVLVYALLAFDASIFNPSYCKRCGLFLFRPHVVLAEFADLNWQKRVWHAMASFIFSVTLLLYVSKQLPFIFQGYVPPRFPLHPKVIELISKLKAGGFFSGDELIRFGYLVFITLVNLFIVVSLALTIKVKNIRDLLVFSFYVYASFIFSQAIMDFVFAVVDRKTIIDIAKPYKFMHTFWMVGLPAWFFARFLREEEVRGWVKHLLIMAICATVFLLAGMLLAWILYSSLGLDFFAEASKP